MNVTSSLFLGIPPAAWSAIIAAFALLVSYTIARFSIRNKQVDFLIYDHKQFDELLKKRTEIKVEEDACTKSKPGSWTKERLEIEADMFFERFWSLQFDSFIGWHEGYLPTSLYKFWLFSRWRELSNPSQDWTLAERNLRTSLEKISGRWAINPDPKSSQTRQVYKFVHLMINLSKGQTIDLDSLLMTYGPHRILRTMRWFLGAY